MTGSADVRVPWLVLQLARELRTVERLDLGAGQLVVAAAIRLAMCAYGSRPAVTMAGVRFLDPGRLPDLHAHAYDRDLVDGADVVVAQERYFDDLGRLGDVFASGLQVDARGNCNLAGIRRADGTWRVRGPGCAGLASLTGHAARLNLYVQEHSRRTLVERVDFISLVGDPAERRRWGLPVPAGGSLVTPFARFEWDERGLVLAATVPGWSQEQLARITGWELRSRTRVEVVHPPSPMEIASYESEVAPWLT